MLRSRIHLLFVDRRCLETGYVSVADDLDTWAATRNLQSMSVQDWYTWKMFGL